MYNNIGERLKTIAKVFYIIGLIGSAIGGIVLIVKGANIGGSLGSPLIGSGFGVIIGGSLASWISSWVAYAIGDTNVKTTAIYKMMSAEKGRTSPAVPKKENGFPELNLRAAEERRDTPQRRTDDIIKCPSCGSMMRSYPCPNCGYEKKVIISPEVFAGMSDGKMKCPECGFVQPAGRKCCFECGVMFADGSAGAEPTIDRPGN